MIESRHWYFSRYKVSCMSGHYASSHSERSGHIKEGILWCKARCGLPRNGDAPRSVEVKHYELSDSTNMWTTTVFEEWLIYRAVDHRLSEMVIKMLYLEMHPSWYTTYTNKICQCFAYQVYSWGGNKYVLVRSQSSIMVAPVHSIKKLRWTGSFIILLIKQNESENKWRLEHQSAKEKNSPCDNCREYVSGKEEVHSSFNFSNVLNATIRRQRTFL